MPLFAQNCAVLPRDLRLANRLGRVVLTPSAKARVSECDLAAALTVHSRRAWGQVGRNSRRAQPSMEGCRLLSVHRTGNGAWFWIITEANHALTTVLLPEDFH